jgi:hypothetical protein
MKLLSTFLLIVFNFSLFFFISCKPMDDYDKLVKETSIKTEYATRPPVANEIVLQSLEKPNKWGNFRMTANLRGQLRDQYLAYEIDGEKIVLRDDGKGADSLAGDGIFSVFINMDESEVKTMVDQQNASVARAESLEAGNRDMATLLRFDKRDTTKFNALHAVLQGDPNFTFVDRQVRFDKKPVSVINFEEAIRLRIPIHLFPHFLCPPPPADLIPKSLMINALSVVEDPARTWNPATHSGAKTGAWTLNNIINQMVNKAATGKTATEFVLAWLQTWDINTPVNGDNADIRLGVDAIISNWKQRSLGHGLPADTLDMAEAPFKLLAIVNRVDLRQAVGYGGGNAGEGRFVFCVMNSNNTAVLNSPMRFTVIFEYGVNKSGCKAVQNWGQQWYDLHSMTLGDPTYNAALQAITDQFVNANTTAGKPNGSSLNQLRTDEFAIGPLPWQLREFNIDATTHLLKLVTVKKNPRNTTGNSLNNSALLASFINANCADILANNYDVPDAVSGQPFVGAMSLNNNGSGDVWNAALTCADPATTRRIFSLNTCNACHGGETQTFQFTHVNVVPFGAVAGLSGFLSGETINDPVSGTPVTFSDLDDRANKLQSLVCLSCKKFLPIIFKPNRMTH